MRKERIESSLIICTKYDNSFFYFIEFFVYNSTSNYYPVNTKLLIGPELAIFVGIAFYRNNYFSIICHYPNFSFQLFLQQTVEAIMQLNAFWQFYNMFIMYEFCIIDWFQKDETTNKNNLTLMITNPLRTCNMLRQHMFNFSIFKTRNGVPLNIW